MRFLSCVGFCSTRALIFHCWNFHFSNLLSKICHLCQFDLLLCKMFEFGSVEINRILRKKSIRKFYFHKYLFKRFTNDTSTSYKQHYIQIHLISCAKFYYISNNIKIQIFVFEFFFLVNVIHFVCDFNQPTI